MHTSICLVVLILTYYSPLTLGHPSLHSKFSNYEILTRRHIAVRVKRDSDGREVHKELTLSVFGRRISLYLKPGLPRSLLSPTANIHAFHAGGRKSPIDLDLNDFHLGRIKGHPGSLVSGFCHEGLWMIQAVEPVLGLSFSVEPLSYHTGLESTTHMVAYQHEDIRRFGNETEKPFDGDFAAHRHLSTALSYHPFLNYTNLKHSVMIKNSQNESTIHKPDQNSSSKSDNVGRHERRRRESPPDKVKVCDMLAIADYTLFQGIGAKSEVKTAKILISVYVLAYLIFRRTTFDAKYTVIIHLSGIEIYTQGAQFARFEKVFKDRRRFVRPRISDKYLNHYCLVHISTQRRFQGDILASGYTAKQDGKKRGICGSIKNGPSNYGYSSMLRGKTLLPFVTYQLLVSHELGHNFGAGHDGMEGASDPECAPSVRDGGKYLMWHWSLTGSSPNNFKLSKCSIRYINGVLKKRANCLKSQDFSDSGKCGNGILEYGEECDDGKRFQGDVLSGTRCCTEDCRFRPNAICSPSNHPCCSETCSVAPETTLCWNTSRRVQCDGGDSFCDGVHFHYCPPVKPNHNGEKCANHGECLNGDCIDYCALFGKRKKPPIKLVKCDCDGNSSTCRICCTRPLDGACLETDKFYDDEFPCEFGFCVNGACKEARPIDTHDWYMSVFNRALSNAASIRKKHKELTTVLICVTAVFMVTCILVPIFIFKDSTIELLSGSPANTDQ